MSSRASSWPVAALVIWIGYAAATLTEKQPTPISAPASQTIRAVGGDAESGRAQLELLRRDAQLPKYGQCWKEALDSLEEGKDRCQRLTDEEQSFLALQFTNCFLERSGQQQFPCSRSQSVAECLSGVSGIAFNAYANFFTHTQNMCYFLQSQVWQEATDDTIHRLSSSSSRVAETLEESASVQDAILHHQRQTLELQKQISSNGSLLSKTLELSKHSLREMMSEFKSSTDEQRTMIFEIFERVSKLQNLVVNEVSWLYTVIFYSTSLLIVYLGTATRRTSDARLWLYCVLTLNFILERVICQMSLPSQQADSETLVDLADDLPERIYERIWLIRKLSLLACFSITVYIAYNFVDYNKVNNRILQEIRTQNAELKAKMELVGVHTRNEMWAASSSLLTERGKFPTPDVTVDELDEGTIADQSSDDDDTLSFTSTMTDRTWLTTRGTTPDVEPDEEFESDNEAAENNVDDLLAELKEADLSSPKLTGQKRDEEHKPFGNVSRYNLRSRSQKQEHNNSILETETQEDFYKTVANMERISRRNAAKIKLAIRRTK